MKRFYYHRNEKGVPQSTICIISENGWNAMGVSICNPKDNFCKKIGRTIAQGRALKALKTMESSGKIAMSSNRDWLKILKRIPNDVESIKSCYNPWLTKFEKKLLGKVEVER